MHRFQPIAVLVFSSILFSVAWIAAGEEGEIAREGTFEGNWSVKGTTHPVEASGRTMALVRVEGRVTVRSSGGLATQFGAECVAVSDKVTGGVGRCVWTDEAGEKIFFEIGGSVVGPMGTSRDARGRVIGGTGRYEGIEGSWDLEWLFVDSALDDTRFKGYVTKLEGRWKRP